MKFTAERKELLKAARTAQKAIAGTVSVAEARGLLLTVNMEHGLICFTGTSIRTTAQTRISSGHIEEEGSVIVPAALITDIFSHFADDTVQCELAGTVMHLACGACTFDIPTMPAERFPNVTLPVPKSVISVTGLRPITQRSVIAASTRRDDIQHQSVKLSFTPEQSTAYAFDGNYRMINAVSTGATGTLDVIIHRQALLLLNDMIGDNDVLYAGVVNNFAVFFKEGLVFSTLIMGGTFHEIDDLVSQLPMTAHALVDAKELLATVDSAIRCLQEGDDQCVKLCVIDHEVTVSAVAFGASSRLSIQAADTEATPLTGYFYRPQLLMDYLRLATGPLKMEFHGDTGFLVLTANHCKYALQARNEPIIKTPKPPKTAAKDKKNETKPKAAKSKTAKKPPQKAA